MADQLKNKATVGQLISEVRVGLKEATADSTLTDRFIWLKIDKHIRWLLSRENRKLKLLHYDNIFQTLKCVNVEQAPTIDPCCGVASKCRVYRTVDKLPELYEDDWGIIVKAVFSIDGSMEFSPIKIQEYIRKLENPEMKYDKSLYYFYNNGYLYFPNTRVDKVMVKGLFIEDLDNEGCITCDDSKMSCKPRQENIIWIPDLVRGELMDYVVKDLLISKQLPNDVEINKNEQRKG